MQNIEATLKNRIESNAAHTFVVIVPTDAARLKRQRELIGYHSNLAVADLQVYDIENFIQRLYNQVRPSRQHISLGLQNLWLHEISGPDSNTYNTFRPIENKPIPDSTLSLIANTINNLKEQGDTAQDIPTETDLSKFYSRYEERLQDRWIDDKGKHLYLAKHLKDDFFKKAFPNVNLVIIEGFSVLSKSDIKIFTHIAQILKMEMWFRTDCYPPNEHLYKNITDLMQEFEDANVFIDSNYERDADQHQHFAENLFRTNTTLNNKIDLKEQIKVLKPTDRSQEVEQIAYLIQKHVSEGDCKLSDICVAYYNVGQYQQRIAEIFPAYGIPYSLSESIPLTKSEVVKEIFSRLSTNRVSMGNTYFSDVKSSSHTHPFHPDEFQEYVDNLLNNGEVVQHILNPMLTKNREIVESEVNAFQQLKKVVRELCAVLKSEGDRSDRLENYIHKLHYVAKHTHYQNRASLKSETVKVVTLGELRSLEFDTVFLGDFVEGGFPPTYRPDPLFPENPYRTEEEQLHDNRFLFYRVLKSFRERLYLLVPKREGESELIPSIFQTQLEAVACIGEEAVANLTCKSIPGFLSAYGNYVWAADNLSDREFPAEIASVRPLIKHAVSVEKSREEKQDKLAYEGILTTENLSPKSQTSLENLRSKVYSVTDLETYAKCPFQYFVAKVLESKVKEDDVEDEPSSLEKGSLIHEVLYEFFKNCRTNEDLSIAQCSDETFEQATQQLDEVLYSKSEDKRLQRSDVSEDNLFWKIEIEKQRVALHKWLKAERSYDLHVMPRYFEVSFGQTQGIRDPELSCSEPISIGDVNMTGRIDRIDIGGGSYNVIDYKTGSSKILMNDILEGRSIQLPIYLQIVQKLLENRSITDSEPAAGLYHKIRLDECTVELGLGKDTYNDIAFRNFNGTEWKHFSKSRQLIDDELFDRRLTRVNGYVQQYVESISNGIFPLITHVETFVDFEDEGDTPITPKDITKPCNYCAYKRICRVGAFVEVSQSEE